MKKQTPLQPSKLIKKPEIISKPTPLQIMKHLKSFNISYDPKKQTLFLMHLTSFTLAMHALPPQFRGVVADQQFQRNLLESLAMLTKNKEVAVCLFQELAPVLKLHILNDLLSILDIILVSRPQYLPVEVATIGLLRQLFKFHGSAMTRQQIHSSSQLLRNIQHEDTVKLAKEMLELLPKATEIDYY